MTVSSATTLTAAEAWLEVASRRIGLTSAFEGRVWLASIESQGEGHNRKRNLHVISATGSTPIAAVAELIKKLDNTPRETALFEEAEPW